MLNGREMCQPKPAGLVACRWRSAWAEAIHQLFQKENFKVIVTVAIDLAKNAFAVHGVDAAGMPALAWRCYKLSIYSRPFLLACSHF